MATPSGEKPFIDEVNVEALCSTTLDVDTFLNLLDNLEDDTVTGECKVEEPQTLHQQATILEGLCQEAPSDTPSFLKQNTVHLAPLPYHDAIQQQQSGDGLVLTHPTGIQTKMPLLGYLNGEKVFQCPPEIEALAALTKKRRKNEKSQEVEDEKPYIKKPPNAFMLFMKEKRPTIASELWKQGSGAVNQILGKMWGSMSNEEKAIYFAEADLHKVFHQLDNPGWTTKENYGKKKKRERMRASKKTTTYTPQLRTKTDAAGAPQPCYPQAAYMPTNQPQPAYMQYPQQMGYILCPQQGGYIQCPQQGGYMQIPQQEEYMQFTEQGYTQAPQQGGYLQDPQQGGYQQVLQQGGYLQDLQQGGYLQDLQQGGYLQDPQQGGYLQVFQQGGYLQDPQQGGYLEVLQQGGYLEVLQQQECIQFTEPGYLQDPQQVEYIQFTEPGYLQDPQQVEYIQFTEPGYLQDPQQVECMQDPQQEECMQFTEQGYLQDPQQEECMQFTEQGYIQDPQQEECMQFTEQGYIQDPQQEECMQDPQQEECMQFTEQGHTQDPQQGEFIQEI